MAKKDWDAALWLYVVKDAPEAHLLLLKELGFRHSPKSGNWYRPFDNRLPQTAATRLHVEERAAALGWQLQIRPLRRGAPKINKARVPSAAAWLSKHDPKPERLAAIKKKRRAARVARQARRNTALIGGRMRPIKP